jgi:hypothetical protein
MSFISFADNLYFEMKSFNGTVLQVSLFIMATAYEMNSDFAIEMRKNLIRSEPSSCSLCGPLILSVLQGCKMKVLNGPIFKSNSMATMSFLLKAT